MDARYINPFIAAVKHVFKTMLATEVTIGKPRIFQANQEPGADVSAVIGFSGDAIGCVELGFPMSTANNTASKFAGTDMAKDHEDFADALGELANMVAGQAKAKLEGLRISISLPSVIIGNDHIVSQSRQKPRLSLPCESPLGNFCVEVAMVVEKRSAAAREPASVGGNV